MEAIVVWKGIELARDIGLPQFVLELDCQLLVK